MSIEKAYNHWSSQYDSNMNRTRDMDKLVTKKVLNDLDFQLVLELGCGTGKNTNWLINKADKILAVDFSEEMLKIAKKKMNAEKVKFQKADITNNWDWTTGDFDLITSSLILEHIQDLDFIFCQAHSNLKRNGYFFISELHPFKQYSGSKARFENEKNELIELEVFTHHISEFLNAAEANSFKLIKLQEWFDEDGNQTPRLLSLLFQKL